MWFGATFQLESCWFFCGKLYPWSRITEDFHILFTVQFSRRCISFALCKVIKSIKREKNSEEPRAEKKAKNLGRFLKKKKKQDPRVTKCVYVFLGCACSQLQCFWAKFAPYPALSFYRPPGLLRFICNYLLLHNCRIWLSLVYTSTVTNHWKDLCYVGVRQWISISTESCCGYVEHRKKMS